jgi:hypothetical protein
MKSLPVLLLTFCGTAAFAGLSDFDVTAEAKLLDQNSNSQGDKKTTNQQWVYEVTMANKSTKDFSNLKVQYIVFIKDAREGGKPSDAKLIRKAGEKQTNPAKSHAKVIFQTDPVALTKTQLASGWTYANGARPRAADSLAGIWLRVFEGDKQVAEFSNPPTLQTRETWPTK